MEYSSALQTAMDAAIEAGKMLREEFHRPGGPRGSGAHAEIDEVVERVIRQRLLAAYPWDYRGEECGYRDNGGRPHLWLVDPNDGTASFLKGRRGSSVSIAALRDGVPVLGVVYAYACPDEEGDLIAWAEGCGPVRRNGAPLEVDLSRVTVDGANPPAVVFVSLDAEDSWEASAACCAPLRFIAMPSVAYRMALVAAGEGAAAVTLTGPCGWDYAAGHALVRASGGVFRATGRRPQGSGGDAGEVTYAADGTSFTEHCFAGAPEVVEHLRRRDWRPAYGKTPRASPPPFRLVRLSPGKSTADAGRLARAQGCLLGQLAGDALGGLVEFRTAAEIREEFPEGVRRLIDGGTWQNLAGQPTDDSEMALMLARTLVHAGCYDRGAVLDAYVHWCRSGPFDIGSTTRQALESAARGKGREGRVALAEKHASRTSQANGSLMRISPLGIFGAGRPELAGGWARQDSGLTHPHPVCRDACAVFVAALAEAVGGGGGPEACYAAALAEAERGKVKPSVQEAVDQARSLPPDDYYTKQGWVLVALQNAFYQILHAPTLEAGVIDTVVRGGDTDTNGAIAGALLGAVHGRRAVPDPWRLAILSCRPLPGAAICHPRPEEFWPTDALELAERLLVAGERASG